jgi:guanine deaminase
MADGYKVQALAGHPLNAWQMLHAATRGAARALALDHEIGSLEPGLVADCCLWDWQQGPVQRHRDAIAVLAQDLHERVFAWITLADERHLAATWVAGRRLYTRD